MKEHIYYNNLEKVYHDSFEISITNEDRIVIFSDLHMGDGGSRDDFKSNSALFKYVLDNYYLPRDYSLILNGDVEELYKFSAKKIYKAWKSLYQTYEKFSGNSKFFKLLGNHDHDLVNERYPDINKKLLESIRINYGDNTIFIYHGHQTSNFIERYNKPALYFVRYIVYPLKIQNPVYPVTSKRRFQTEVRSYNFSKQRKIISILGHTHRPLFESMSKMDYLTVRIENLIRKYPKANPGDKETISALIEKYKQEIISIEKKNGAEDGRFGLYNDNLLVPCLFNSGSVIGKHGITGIEIKKGKIYLVYWFDRNLSSRYLEYRGVKSKQFDGTDFYKALLNTESLDYVFSRINLLS